MGAILYEMLTGKTLDEGVEIKQYFENIQNNNRVDLGPQLSSFSEVVKSIFEASLSVSHEERATCHKLKYIFDKNLGPMINLSDLPSGAIIKPLTSQGATNIPSTMTFSTNKNPLMKYNFSHETSSSNRTPIGTPMKKDVQFKKHNVPCFRSEINGKHNIVSSRKSSLNDQIFKFEGSNNNFQPSKVLNHRSKISSANQVFSSKF